MRALELYIENVDAWPQRSALGSTVASWTVEQSSKAAQPFGGVFELIWDAWQATMISRARNGDRRVNSRLFHVYSAMATPNVHVLADLDGNHTEHNERKYRCLSARSFAQVAKQSFDARHRERRDTKPR